MSGTGLYVRLPQPQDQCARRLKAAVEIDGRDQRFHHVTQHADAQLNAIGTFPAPETHMLVEAGISRHRRA